MLALILYWDTHFKVTCPTPVMYQYLCRDNRVVRKFMSKSLLIWAKYRKLSELFLNILMKPFPQQMGHYTELSKPPLVSLFESSLIHIFTRCIPCTPHVMNSPFKKQLYWDIIHITYNSVALHILTDMCNHNHSQFYNIFITSKRNLVPFSYHLPTPPQTLQAILVS